MSTTVPPRDGDRATPAPRIPLADEEALHRAFLAEYPTLAAEARADLGDDAVALGPKVVEGAFVRAWDQRTTIRTPDELHAFLVEDVHHAAARALSRRAAAHRLGGSDAHSAHGAHNAHGASHSAAHATTGADGMVNPEESWGHILHAVKGEGHSPGALAEAAAISRHDAAGHIAIVTREQTPWRALILGGVALAVVIAAGFWVERLGADARLAGAVNAADVRVVTSLPAQVGVVTLDDGTQVRLAPESKLSIPASFSRKLRAVKLEGTANFQVAKGLESEFRVYARDAIVIATGTAFTVRAYPGENEAAVVVSEGSVEVRQGSTTRALQPGGTLVVSPDSAPRAATPAEREGATSWETGTLTITNRQLRDVLPQLHRWYGLDIKVLDTPLLSRPVTLRASLDSSLQAIRGVEKSTGLQFGYEGQTMVLREPAAGTSRTK